VESKQNCETVSSNSKERERNSSSEKLARDMTTREMFAAMAMQGWFARHNGGYTTGQNETDDLSFFKQCVAPGLVACADALLAELAKERK
jgi:hypothetical protein